MLSTCRRSYCYRDLLATARKLTCNAHIHLGTHPVLYRDHKETFRLLPATYAYRFHRVYSTTPPPLPPEESGRYKVLTIPNLLCVARIGLTPVIASLVLHHNFTPAFGLLVIAGATDLLDGYIARNVPGQKSLLGSVLDPVADKLLVNVMFVTLTMADLIPVALTAVVILRDVCLITGGFYKRYKTMNPPYSLNRFFNPEVSSMQIIPTMMSKINTVLQLTLVAASLASPVFSFGETAQLGVTGLACATAFTTIYSGLQYASGNAFKKIM